MNKFLFISLFLFGFSLNGAVLDNIQSGSVTMPSGTATVTVSITAVDLTKSFLIFSVSGQNDGPTHFMVGGHLSAADEIEFVREGTAPELEIGYQVFEFASGVSVQRGEAAAINSGSPFERNVTISSVDLTESFATVTYTCLLYTSPSPRDA